MMWTHVQPPTTWLRGQVGPPAALLTVLGLCMLLLSGCALFEEEGPPIEDSTLIEVLVELHLLDARSQLEYDVSEDEREAIFARYNLSEERFEEALRYYAHRPEEYLQIYRDVIEAMNEEEAQMRDPSVPH